MNLKDIFIFIVIQLGSSFDVLTRRIGLCTVSLMDTAVQLTGVNGSGLTSIRPFGSTEQHHTETGGYKTAINRCRRPSIVLTLTKMMIIISILRIEVQQIV